MSDTLSKRDPWSLATIAWTAVALVYVTLIPVGNNVLLYPLLLSFAVLAAINIVRRRVRPDRSLLLPAALWLAFLVLGIVTALARDAEYWQRTLVFFLIWPAVFSVIVAGFDRRVVRILFLVGAWLSVVTGVLLLIQALAEGGILPFRRLPAWIAGPLRMTGSSDSGMVSLTSTVMPPLIWWGGIWIASLFCDPKDRYLPPVWLRSLAGALVLTGALVSWRRGIVIVLVAAPVIALVMLVALKVRNTKWSDEPRLTPRGFLRLGVVAVVGVALGLVCQPHLLSMFGTAVSSSSGVIEGEQAQKLPLDDLSDPGALTVSESDALADTIRKNESRLLLTPSSPADLIVGRGLGAAIDRGELVRVMRPWQTELQYHAIFYWTGLVGVLLLFAVGVAAFLAVRKAYRLPDGLRGALFVSSVGAVCVLMANATNPYLQAPGHQWPVFLPLMIASAVLTDAARRRKDETEPEAAGTPPEAPRTPPEAPRAEQKTTGTESFPAQGRERLGGRRDAQH